MIEPVSIAPGGIRSPSPALDAELSAQCAGLSHLLICCVGKPVGSLAMYLAVHLCVVCCV